MSKPELIDPIEDPRWDEFVDNHPLGWICHLSGWKRVIEKSFKHMKGYYFVIWDGRGSNIRAGLPLFHVKSWLTGNRLVSIPFATLCDPLVTSESQMVCMIDCAMDLFETLNASNMQIRTLTAAPYAQSCRLEETTYYKHHYLLLQEEPEMLKRTFHRSCVRQRISRAQKCNLSLRIGSDIEDLTVFYRLHSMNRKRLGLPVQPYRFFENLWEVFQPARRIQLLLAMKEEEVIAAMILFNYKERVSAEFAASDISSENMSPNHFLFWEAIKLAYEQGYKVFDFGRTAPANTGLMDFKSRWGTLVVDLPQFFYPKAAADRTCKMEKTWKYKMASKICKQAPGLLQEKIGQFFYGHLG